LARLSIPVQKDSDDSGVESVLHPQVLLVIDLSSRIPLVEQISGTDGVREPLVPTVPAATATTKCPTPSTKRQKNQKEDQENRWEDHEK